MWTMTACDWKKTSSRRKAAKPSGTEKEKRPKGLDSRKVALETLLKVETEDAFSNVALSSALDKSQLARRDKAFVTCLVQGVVRNKTLIDERIKQFSKKPLEKLPAVLKTTLRLGIFQLEFLGPIYFVRQ